MEVESLHVTLLLFSRPKSESRKNCEHRMTLQNLMDSACDFLFDFNRKRASNLSCTVFEI